MRKIKTTDDLRVRNREYQKKWYAKNKELHKQRNLAARNKKRDVYRKYIRAIKSSTPCADCGSVYPWYVMDFHHTKSANKEMDVSLSVSRVVSFNRLKLEIEKCVILCSNCHRIRTFSENIEKQIKNELAH